MLIVISILKVFTSWSNFESISLKVCYLCSKVTSTPIAMQMTATLAQKAR